MADMIIAVTFHGVIYTCFVDIKIPFFIAGEM